MALIDRLKATYEANRDEELAAPMRAYMREQFPFLGIKRDTRDELDRAILEGEPAPTEAALARVARACWKLPEREYQYFAQKYLRKHAKVMSASFLDVAEELITHKSWWDTVDDLAQHVVGTLVMRHPALKKQLDVWARSENLWLARTAILHQNRYKAATDEKRLFAYCRARADETDFFMRKAIGWALREYSATNPKAVKAFVAATKLSPLSAKEALRKT